MNYSRIVRDGSARDEALKRRNGAVSEVLRMGPTPKRETEQPAEQKPTRSPASALLRRLSRQLRHGL
jgi:hypothetical protein